MSNVDEPRGATPVGHLNGGEIRIDPNTFEVTATKICAPGDFVVMVDAGTVEPATAGANLIYGVVAGGKNSQYIASADTDREVLLYTDPGIIYEIQGDDLSSSSKAIEGCVGHTADIVVTAAGTYTGPYGVTMAYSKHELDDSTIGDASGELMIVGKKETPDNEWGEHCKLHVIINQTQLHQAGAGL